MKRFLFFIFLFTSVFATIAEAQKRRVSSKTIRKPALAAQTMRESSNTAVVVDERLGVLRLEPSLFSKSFMRMQNGRKISILNSKEADGVTFYRVNAPPNYFGWVQAEAIAGRFRRGDDARLAKLIQASEGFEQIERAQIFFETFADSPLRPAILLLLGDLLEEIALKISGDATRRLDRREMAASGAPLHSFYLNFVALDRYRKININFLFNSNTRLLHYDGASWREITRKFSNSSEAVEAQKRLVSLKEKMDSVK